MKWSTIYIIWTIIFIEGLKYSRRKKEVLAWLVGMVTVTFALEPVIYKDQLHFLDTWGTLQYYGFEALTFFLWAVGVIAFYLVRSHIRDWWRNRKYQAAR